MEEKEIEIDLKQLFDALLARIWVIVAVMVLAGVFALVCSKYAIKPLYTSSAKIYVNSSKNVLSDDINQSQLNSSALMATVYVQMLKSNDILDDVIELSEVQYPKEKLKKMIDAKAVEDTPILEIKVTAPDPVEAANIAGAIVQVAPDRMIEIMEGGSVKIIDVPEVPLKPSSPNVLKNTLLGLILGFLASSGIVILLELMDSRIRDEEQLRNMFELPVLGVIPEIVVSEE